MLDVALDEFTHPRYLGHEALHKDDMCAPWLNTPGFERVRDISTLGRVMVSFRSEGSDSWRPLWWGFVLAHLRVLALVLILILRVLQSVLTPRSKTRFEAKHEMQRIIPEHHKV